MQGCGYSFLPMMGGVVELFARMITALIAMKLVSFPLACFCDPAAWVGAALFTGFPGYPSEKAPCFPAAGGYQFFQRSKMIPHFLPLC